MKDEIKKKVHKFIREENFKSSKNWLLLKAIYSSENDYFKEKRYFFMKYFNSSDWFLYSLDYYEFCSNNIHQFFENYFNNINNFLLKFQNSRISYKKKILNNKKFYSQDIRNFYNYIDKIFREKFNTYEEIYIFLIELEKYFKCDIIINDFMIKRLKKELKNDFITDEEYKREKLKKLEEMRENRL
jgi:hypothetical protein